MSGYIILFVLLIILLFAIYVFDYKQNKKIFRNKKTIIIFIILMLPVFSFFTVMADPEEDNTINTDENPLISVYDTSSAEIKKLSLNKVVIVGDSRMEYIENKEDELDIPSNFIFDAKSGAKIKWTEENGIPTLNDILENQNKDTYYHVLFNMGVNDLNDNIDIKEQAEKYFNLYKEVIENNDNVQFYLLSVNPIDEDVINDNFKTNIRTNAKIEEFNYYLKRAMINSDLSNIKYCDSYNNLEFNLPDGLHYDTKTDQKIIDYIANKCIEFK